MASFAVEEFRDDLLAFIEGTAGAGCRGRTIVCTKTIYGMSKAGWTMCSIRAA